MMKMTRSILFVMLAGVLPLASAGEVPTEVSRQEEGCSGFEDWRDHRAGKDWHQHSSSPRPWDQRPGDWEQTDDPRADGRRHELAGGETLDDYWAHHNPCAGN